MARILLVEDDVLMLSVLSLSLRRAGHTVLTASSVQQARAVLAANQIDVLVSDLTLPDRDGDELAAACPVPAIAMSGLDGEDAAKRSARAGFARHLAKPFELEDLLEAVRKLTGAAPESSSTGGHS
jgi:two-component system OmpR family response regulator